MTLVSLPTRVAELERRIAELTAERDALRADAERRQIISALTSWQSYGCPECGGDCSSANPPVSLCIMRETRAALEAASGEVGK